MNGDIRSNGSAQPHVKLENGPSNNLEQSYVAQIIQALEVVHDPRSSNEMRRQAHVLLEAAQSHGQAPHYGMVLASDPSQPPVVRHYGLSLLEKTILYSRDQTREQYSMTIRAWAVQLAEGLSNKDPLYIRNKTAKVWVEHAKMRWAKDWMDMDALLVNLWSRDLVRKEFVAVVLETLSEDIFRKDNVSASLRAMELSRAYVDIFTPVSILREHYPARDTNVQVRYGTEGWLLRLADFLDWSMPEQVISSDEAHGCTLSVYACLKSALTWTVPKAISAAHCVERICKGLLISNLDIQVAAVEALHALYGRSNLRDDDIIALVFPMIRSDSVRLLGQLFQWSNVEAVDINADRYALAKKISEMISLVGNFLEGKPSLLPADSDLDGFLKLLLEILANQSLAISIPVLSTWTKLLRSHTVGDSEVISSVIGPLLEICSRRLIRYEHLPPDSEDPTVLFLNEDIDTTPERHAFLGNYRRYCVQVVETIVFKRPFEALHHVLTQVGSSLQALYNNRPQFHISSYFKNSSSFLQVDAQLTVVDAACKGYMKWTACQEADPQQDEQKRAVMQDTIENWCEHVLNMEFEDPLIQKRILQVAVSLATSVLEKQESFILRLLKHIFTRQLTENLDSATYSEAVKDFQMDCTYELQRLAMKMPDFLSTVYDELEAKINEIIAARPAKDRQILSFQTFLFIINHRATTRNADARLNSLKYVIKALEQSWQNPELSRQLETFAGFCDLAGVTRAQNYLLKRRAHEIEDWSLCDLDDEGKMIQAEMTESFHVLPLRPTKSFLGASVERVQKGSEQHKLAGALWQSAMPIILPGVLKFLGYSHAYHHISGWAHGSREMLTIASRTLSDRFWQAGISTGSRDDFYAKVSGTKATLEGLASSLRGVIRSIREACYSILYCMSKLEGQFYGYEGLPEPLAQALFADAAHLPSHQLATMITMVRHLIDDCPIHRREVFLSPLLSNLFAKLDSKITDEWKNIAQRAQANSLNDDLTEEMKDESVLRQLTNAGVVVLAGLLDPQRESPADTTYEDAGREEGSAEPDQHPCRSTSTLMRDYVLSSVAVLQSLIIFCTHIIQTPDMRSCTIVLRVLKSIVPDFTGQTEMASAIREYISSDVLKAAITSFHDPQFVDVQKDLVSLIATIYIAYAPLSDTPRSILLSLPGVTSDEMESVHQALFAAASPRRQRALISTLLESVRGVSISEQGRIMPEVKRDRAKAKEKSAMQAKFMTARDEHSIKKEGSPDLAGVSTMLE